jgi:predicted MFS family arabinose efflux permease
MLYFFSWNYAYPYQLAIVNAVDATGRGVAITQAFGFLGVAGGAGLAAFFVTPGDYRAVTWLVVVAVFLSTVLFLLSSAVHRHAGARMPVAEGLG